MNIKNHIKQMLLGAGLLLAVLPSEAQNIIRPKIAGPNGLWVNSYNGVLFFGQTDMETQNSQMPMQLRFYYNSSAQSTNYGYGLGFSLGYEMRYRINEIGGVVIETGDGRSDTYKKFGKEFEAGFRRDDIPLAVESALLGNVRLLPCDFLLLILIMFFR